MKVLLDENLPQDLRHYLPGHQVSTVGDLRWHISNDARLLERAATFGFDVFVTCDAGLKSDGRAPGIAVITLECASSVMDDLRKAVVPLLETLGAFRPNTAVAIPG
jgi:predicted nuclease of predicted toxin-antitoxin system